MNDKRTNDNLKAEQEKIYDKYSRGLTVETAEQTIKTTSTICGAIAHGLGNTWSIVIITIIGSVSLFCLHLAKIIDAKTREGPEDNSLEPRRE